MGFSTFIRRFASISPLVKKGVLTLKLIRLKPSGTCSSDINFVSFVSLLQISKSSDTSRQFTRTRVWNYLHSCTMSYRQISLGEQRFKSCRSNLKFPKCSYLKACNKRLSYSPLLFWSLFKVLFSTPFYPENTFFNADFQLRDPAFKVSSPSLAESEVGAILRYFAI